MSTDTRVAVTVISSITSIILAFITTLGALALRAQGAVDAAAPAAARRAVDAAAPDAAARAVAVYLGQSHAVVIASGERANVSVSTRDTGPFCIDTKVPLNREKDSVFLSVLGGTHGNNRYVTAWDFETTAPTNTDGCPSACSSCFYGWIHHFIHKPEDGPLAVENAHVHWVVVRSMSTEGASR